MPEHKSNTKPRVRFIGDGTTSDFFYDFMTFSPEDLDIYLNDVLQSGGYDVSINENGGGRVHFGLPPANGCIVTIIRNLEFKRTSDFQEGGAFRAKVINHELDYQVASLQQLEEKISRTVTFPPYAPTQLDVSLPTPEAGKAIVWNADGNSLENSDIAINSAFKDMQNYVEECRNNAQNAEQAYSLTKAAAEEGVAQASAKAEQAEIEAIRAENAATAAVATVNNKADIDLNNIVALSENAKTKIHTTFGINTAGVIQYAVDSINQAFASGFVIVIAPTGSNNGAFISIGSTAASLVNVAKIDTVNQGYVTVSHFVAKGQYFQGSRKNAVVYFYPLISGE